MKIIGLILFFMFFVVGTSIGADKVDLVAQEYIEQISNLAARITYNAEKVNNDLKFGNMVAADKDITEMASLYKEYRALKLDALKYYKGNLPKDFVSEWDKQDKQIKVLMKKK